MIYASKSPSDLNHDPEPWTSPWDRRVRYSDDDYGWQSRVLVREPRPEFDHVQNSTPNPILLDLRQFWPVVVDDWLAALEDPYFIVGTPHNFGQIECWHVDHARRVLSRLASIEAVA